MTWTTTSLKVPDDHDWVALTNVTPNGDAEIIGYIARSDLGAMLATSNELHDRYHDWLNQEPT